jgi:predicted metal-dependent phosphoesterase TrpH
MSLICDFHAHSTVSDGTLTPAELVLQAHRSGVDVLALTDHDDVAGIPEALARAQELGMELLPGVELSVSEAGGKLQMHILGLGIDPSAPLLIERIVEFRRARLERGARIVERLNQLGMPIRFERVREIAKHGSLGRPHVARALVEAGICSSEDDAFARFLRWGRRAYVPHAGRDARGAISLIHAVGGIACLAHPPRSLGVDATGGLEAFVGRLARLELDALEVYHPSHKPQEQKRLRRLARKHALTVTGGSDFHGDERPEVALGRGRGELALGRECYDAIRERLAERQRANLKLTVSEPTGTLARPV